MKTCKGCGDQHTIAVGDFCDPECELAWTKKELHKALALDAEWWTLASGEGVGTPTHEDAARVQRKVRLLLSRFYDRGRRQAISEVADIANEVAEDDGYREELVPCGMAELARRLASNASTQTTGVDDKNTPEQSEAFCRTLFQIIAALGWTSETATPDDGEKIVEGVRAMTKHIVTLREAQTRNVNEWAGRAKAAEADYAACAAAIGVEYAPDTGPTAPGPRAAVVEAIVHARRAEGQLREHELRGRFRADDALADARRRWRERAIAAEACVEQWRPLLERAAAERARVAAHPIPYMLDTQEAHDVANLVRLLHAALANEPGVEPDPSEQACLQQLDAALARITWTPSVSTEIMGAIQGLVDARVKAAFEAHPWPVGHGG